MLLLVFLSVSYAAQQITVCVQKSERKTPYSLKTIQFPYTWCASIRSSWPTMEIFCCTQSENSANSIEYCMWESVGLCRRRSQKLNYKIFVFHWTIFRQKCLYVCVFLLSFVCCVRCICWTQFTHSIFNEHIDDIRLYFSAFAVARSSSTATLAVRFLQLLFLTFSFSFF